MKIFNINLADKRKNIDFNSTRNLKNTVSQLAKNNSYSLTEPNQRHIINSIKELAKQPGKKNIEFLLSTAAQATYATNIKLKNMPKYDWKQLLLNAAAEVLAITPFVNQTEYTERIRELSKTGLLNKEEKEIMKSRDILLNKVDLKQIQNETVGGIKDFKGNLDYFIVSSETTLEQKKYVLERLNYLMSDEYEINPQLKDKKSIVAAEIINDLAIFTPGHEIPNIKSVNQKQHGICAAISIVRKKIAYEDKANYIDAILSELDSTDYISVYNRSNLGSGEKSLLRKVPVDFKTAIARGYRIIDASSTQWMQLAQMSGYSGLSYNNYTPFDKENFDAKTDSFYNAHFENQNLSSIQSYYQALIKAGETIKDYKAELIKANVNKTKNKSEEGANIRALNDVKYKLSNVLLAVNPDIKDALNIINGLYSLRQVYSNKLKPDNKFGYIDNEEEIVKKEKIKGFLINNNFKAESLTEDILNRIYLLTDTHHFLQDKVYLPKTTNSALLNKARVIYEIGAVNRYQFLKGFENDISLSEMMKKQNIPSKEECILNTIEQLLSKLNAKSDVSNDIIKSLAQNSGYKINNLKSAISYLNKMKKRVQVILSKDFNKIYKSLNYGNKYEALASYIEAMEIAVLNKDKNITDMLAEKYQVKGSAEKLIPILKEIKFSLSEESDKVYNNAFNKLAGISQIDFMKDIFNNFLQVISGEDNNEVIQHFIINNKIKTDNLESAINEKLSDIRDSIDNLENELGLYTQILTIYDAEGDVLYSASPSDILMKELENNDVLVSAKKLRELQVHLDKAQKVRSADEFNSRQGRLSDKSLYEFTKTEKRTIKTIEKSINQTYGYIKKQLTSVEGFIKKPLEELKRMVGLDIGRWWVNQEGHSGLAGGEDIRILEYITGRPHHITNDIKDAIEKIKFSPYSGISTSSVFHDKVGMHAQYIADIEPVKIKDNAGNTENTVDVLFQDNSWGASEHENTWTDSKGLTRTDYSDYRGGTLGYITNDKYRNGNLVRRVIGDMVLNEEPDVVESKVYKRIKKDFNDNYQSPQYTRIILDGKSPQTEEIADDIHDTIFKPSTAMIKVIQKLTKNMTKEDIDSKINALQVKNKNWKNICDKLFARIHGNDNGVGIQTKEDYDRLSDDDILKLELEKAALKNNYPITDAIFDMVKVKDIKDLNKFEKMQKRRAINDFKYSFGKHISILEYVANSITDDDYEIIDNILAKYNYKLTDKDYEEIFETFAIQEEDFTGSVFDMIGTLTKSLRDKLDKITDNQDMKNEIVEYMESLFANKLYFNISDIDNPKIAHIIKFIDRVYNPTDDNALVNIFINLQDMTNSEFKEKVLPLLTKSDLNIKNETGFDILKKIQRYESESENDLENAVYIDELYRFDTKSSKYKTEYDNYKLYRTPTTTAKYTFESAYRKMKNDLSMLNLPKLFNKYKDRNLNKYGVYPAYPMLEYMPARTLRSLFDSFIEPITDFVEQIKSANEMIECYSVSDELKRFTRSILTKDIITQEQFSKINFLLGRIVTLTLNDDSMQDVNLMAQEAMEIEEGSIFKPYKKLIEQITSKIDGYQKAAPVKALQNGIDEKKDFIAQQSETFVRTYIRTRYQNKVWKTLQDYKQSLIKQPISMNGVTPSDKYKALLWEEMEKHNILQEPEEALERYIKSIPPDSELHKHNNMLEALLQRSLGYAMLYNIQSTIMDALSNGIETDVKTAFKDIQIDMTDGSTISMDSGQVLMHIVRELILDYKEDTAILFLEKLGLNEPFVKYAAESLTFDGLKELIDKAAVLKNNYEAFGDVYNSSLKEAIDKLKSGEKTSRVAATLSNKINMALKAYSINKSDVKHIKNSISVVKKTCVDNPQLDASEIFASVLYSAIANVQNSIAIKFEEINQRFRSQEVMVSLINNVLLSANTEASKVREEMNERFHEISEYSEKMLGSGEEISESNTPDDLQENE